MTWYLSTPDYIVNKHYNITSFESFSKMMDYLRDIYNSVTCWDNFYDEYCARCGDRDVSYLAYNYQFIDIAYNSKVIMSLMQRNSILAPYIQHYDLMLKIHKQDASNQQESKYVPFDNFIFCNSTEDFTKRYDITI
jgi:hypothetical protein